MNKQHRCIKFSSETERNNSFLFREINVTVKITNLKHLLIKNLLSVVFFTHYESCIDQFYKKSLISTLLFRRCFLCWDYTLFHFKVEKQRDFLKKEPLSVRYYRNFNKNFRKQPLCSKTSIFNSSEKGATNNFSISWKHFIKFKAKTAYFCSKVNTIM